MNVAREVPVDCPMHVKNLMEPLVIVPLDRWTKISEKALRFAMKLSANVESPYRFVIMPLVSYILKIEQSNPDRQIAVLVPELVVEPFLADSTSKTSELSC